ncbi:MAG: M48 family metallopeptidase [Burkholderiales bacterium]|nr:M48 family metallopeptidase [Burkholderiales bacterium]
MRRFAATVAVAAAIAGLSGCQTNPVTGRSQLIFVSEDSAIAQSKQAYVQMLQPFAKAGKLDNDPAVTARIVAITERLIPPAIAYRPETKDWEWSVKVIDDPKTVNAWCMAGGKMAFYTGLIVALKPTDDEIAQVMGHEIAHALSKHQAEKMSQAMATQGAALGASIFLGSKYGAAAGVATMAAAQVAITLPNSRAAETEADRIGIELAARAGYDPRAAVTLWQKMGKATGSAGKGDFFSTHPAPERRQERLAELVPQMLPFFEDPRPRPVFKLRTQPLAARPVSDPARVADAR